MIGTPDFFLSATPDACGPFPVPGGILYRQANGRAPDAFSAWDLSVEDVVLLLTGAFPFREDSPSSAGSLWRERKDAAGNVQTVWIDREGRPDKVICRNVDGADIYSAGYADYDGANRLSGKITLRWAKSGASVTVRYADWKIEPAADTAVFSLPYPPGVKIISLD